MGSAKDHSRNGGINQDYSNAESLICCLCHEPYDQPDHFSLLIEGIPPVCERCLSEFHFMDYKDNYREITFWIVFHHTPSLSQIYENLIQHHRVESMKGLVWPIRWFIQEYVSKWNPVFVFFESIPWVSEHREVLHAWKHYLYPSSLGIKPKKDGSVGYLMNHILYWDNPINAKCTNTNNVYIIFHFNQLFMLKAWIDKHLDVMRPNDRILVFSCECRELKETVG